MFPRRMFHDIEHPTDQLTGDKLNFFADSIEIVNTKAGTFYDYEIETHGSFLNDHIYFIRNAIESGDDNRLLGINKQTINLFKFSNLFSEDDLFINSFFKDVFKVINGIKKIELHKINTKKDATWLLGELNVIKDRLTPSYIENLATLISTLLRCSHTLSYHRDDLNYSSKLLVSYYFLSGFPKTEINNFVARVLTMKVEVQGERIYCQSPLPELLYKRMIEHNRNNCLFNKKLHDDINYYLKSRTLNEQYIGFSYFAHCAKHEYTFWFRISSFAMQEDIEVDGIELLNVSSFKKRYPDSIKYVEDFLSIHRSVLAKVVTSAYSQDEAVFKSLDKLRETIDGLGDYINGRISIDDSQYLGTGFDEFYVNETGGGVFFDKYSIRTMKNRRARVKKNRLSNKTKKLEEILFQAKGETDKFNSTALYSKFCDNLIPVIPKTLSGRFPNKIGISSKVFGMVFLLLAIEKKSFKFSTEYWAFNVMVNSFDRSDKLGTTEAVLRGMTDADILVPLEKINQEINHAHTSYRVRKALYFNKKSYYKSFQYYLRVFAILNSSRNVGEHMNNKDELINRKIQTSIHGLLKRVFDGLLFERGRVKYQSLTDDELIIILIEKGLEKTSSFFSPKS
ncbi:MAG: hypothetical protein HRT71_02460 [Flavobacteriales bacterium]|nr:hypothetical protein [Flavobacteriales bacterium]